MLCKQDRHPTDDFPKAATAHAATLQDRSDSWYVVYTKPRQESVAEFNLQCQEFETYLPLFKVIKKAALADRQTQDALEPSTVYEPMFPRYLFFKPANQRQSIAAARSSRGVQGLVTFGAELAMVQPNVVRAIRELEAERNSADITGITPFQPGRRVRLRDTALEGMEGVVHAVGAKRVVLLMTILGRKKTLKVTHGQLELV
ncbi:transcriptional activator RfaH [Pollutimonas nitritireducens]|uniref:Transcriptional activator RfaH n=1 Tax=Pollutimonas nitritireducens TaxID=2045209 RepID=A0A2N4UDD7_9BURK|nr:transcription termination/antitermination NusG family protein [Pollutimonas nitritireducens]PLC53038.1 transcriptional activator RfaH [Pollutimonas nitritireducens]